MVVVFEGSTDDFWAKMSEIVEKVVMANEQKKLIPIGRKEACKLLEVSYPTLCKILKAERVENIYLSDIDRLKLAYPKYARK